jgi:archaellum component FlaF (FlaF/FlaG flagellin family)
MSGTGTAAAAAIILIGLVTGLMLAQPSLDNAINDLEEARDENTEMSLALSNSGISIGSVSFNNTTNVLNLTIVNEGAQVILTSDINILLNGTMATWTSPVTYVYPDSNLDVSLNNVTDPRSLKVIERFGIADQTRTIIRE